MQCFPWTWDSGKGAHFLHSHSVQPSKTQLEQEDKKNKHVRG